MTDYDEVDYPARPFAQCHPERLAVMARLYGLKPESTETARILEIGCGDGLNLIASSIVLPKANFRGIDISKRAIQRGRRMIRELGIGNVRLDVRDVLDLAGNSGRYHYVVAHGLYSWVPDEVREGLMEAICMSLAPNGVAFVSYNTYPGAYLRQMVREMALLLGGADMQSKRKWLADAASLQSGPPVYRAVLADEARDMMGRDDGALFHDDFAEFNRPCYFRDFIREASAHGLEYIADADPGIVGVHEDGDRVLSEQHADYLAGRRFRQSLLCLAGAPVLRKVEPNNLGTHFIGGPVNPGQSISDGAFLYENRLGARMVTRNTDERRLLEAVSSAWPEYLRIPGFEATVPGLFAAGMIDVRTNAPPVLRGRKSVRPKASPLARRQSETGGEVTSLHHVEVVLGSESLRAVLSLADGTRTRAALIRELRKLYPEESGEKVALALDRHLDELSQYGLLLSDERPPENSTRKRPSHPTRG